MSDAHFDADMLIDEIDEGLRAQSRSVARSLLRHIDSSDADLRALIKAYDAGESINAAEWAERIWAKIEGLPLEQQGALRLSLSLFYPDAVLDWHDAGYLIDWARKEGVSEESIISCFPAPSSAKTGH